ncbi:hypothetical protein Tco_1132722 [Tanacetum coccineum]|uniref:Uncharacterized protein n=1 Tax=Tanacetum coccineum TaxID=301880 RepID=A0ABQ5JDU3_9ASTR
MIHPESEGSTQGYPLDSIEVLSHGPNDALHYPPQPLKVDPDGFEGYLKMEVKVFKITFSHSSQDKGTSSSLKSMITTSNHKLMIEVKDHELKTKGKAKYARFTPSAVTTDSRQNREHQWYFAHERLEYIGVHVNDDSESS